VSWLPGWASADDAEWWSSFYFWFGVASLVLLGCGEVLSHFYGLRRDELVAVSERAIEDQRNSAQREADRRREAETSDLQRKAEAAEHALIELQRQRNIENIPLYKPRKTSERIDEGLSKQGIR
jgi:hypothetical protein